MLEIKYCSRCDALIAIDLSEYRSEFHLNFHEQIDEMQGTIDKLVDLISKNAPEWLIKGEK
jgi:hypothetical protein